MGLHAKLHKVLVRFHSRHHCKLGGSVKGEWIGNTELGDTGAFEQCQPTYIRMLRVKWSGFDFYYIHSIIVNEYGMAFSGCGYLRVSCSSVYGC